MCGALPLLRRQFGDGALDRDQPLGPLPFARRTEKTVRADLVNPDAPQVEQAESDQENEDRPPRQGIGDQPPHSRFTVGTKMYPAPRTVLITAGALSLISSLRRSRLTCTSILLSKEWAERLRASSSNRSRERTRLGCSRKASRRSYSPPLRSITTPSDEATSRRCVSRVYPANEISRPPMGRSGSGLAAARRKTARTLASSSRGLNGFGR